MLIEKSLRVFLRNGRRGPEALVLREDQPSSSSSPTAPWKSFTVSTYMDVRYPTQTERQYEFEIRDFFKVHPLLVVRAFDRHERVFRFPATHCVNDEDDHGRDEHGRDGKGRDDGDRGDPALPHDGASADGNGSSGSPSPKEGDHPQNGQSKPGTPGSGSTIRPLPSGSAAAGRSTGLLSARHIGIAAGGLLVLLGTLATAWLLRRRSGA
ncbi:hypothetical protein ACFC1R_28065 [Kitasatospora sp. NPDC056138]|uniref:hypothetical protein n=1 Tax=Kitasatospora sp. NPDC056138 TaxID=3345724 RepID=UPI0035DB9D8E